MNIIAGDSSTISYVIPMVASDTGYESRLEIHLDELSITSSLNDIQLLSAESCRVRGELPSPLKWNGHRTWTVAVSARKPVAYILRDHINMFTDLAKDWTSGPPTDYNHFLPTKYSFELDLYQYDLSLYGNDFNIIDRPLVLEENSTYSYPINNMCYSLTLPSLNRDARPQTQSCCLSTF